MRFLKLTSILLVYSFLFSCGKKAVSEENKEVAEQMEMPAQGFADPEAAKIASGVMEQMGGEKAWNDLRYLSWTFFGRRKLLWDKHEQLVRVEAGNYKIIVDLKDKSGQAVVDGRELTANDSLKQYLQKGYEAWINDSYWLVMPFKLRDPGVNLRYLGKDTLSNGKSAEMLEMTFKKVGVTPQNKYHVWVGDSSKLVNQWAFFPSVQDSVARFTLPWEDYKSYNGVLLSDNRGNNAITDLKTPEAVSETAFTDLTAEVF